MMLNRAYRSNCLLLAVTIALSLLSGAVLGQPAVTTAEVAQVHRDSNGPHDSAPPVRETSVGAHADSVIGVADGSAVESSGEGTSAHGEGTSAHGEGSEHIPSFTDINWFYGMLGEQEGVEPSVIYRPKGMPVPLAALILNSAIVLALLYFGMRVPVAEGLKKRKAAIMQGMDDAGRMKGEAQQQLGEYERKLASIDDAIEEVRTEMQQASEAERRRVLADAVERRSRMERDAKRLIEQELQAARERLQKDAVRAAVAAAAAQLRAQASSPTEQQQVVDQYIQGLAHSARLSVGGDA